MHTMTTRTTLLMLFSLVFFTGCNVSYYKQDLASHLPREDGSMLDVRCVSYVKHTVSSVSLELQPTPQVTVIMDDKTFVIYADRIILNGERYADLASDVKAVYIEFTEEGFEVDEVAQFRRARENTSPHSPRNLNHARSPRP